MIKSLNQRQVKRLTAIHGWSGMVLGLLLYAVVLTGTVVVFAHEIGVWSLGGKHTTEALSTGVDDKIRPVLDKVPKGYLADVGIRTTIAGDIRLTPHAHVKNPKTGQLDNFGTVFIIDPATGVVKERNEGFFSEGDGWFGDSALRRFWVDLHVQLHLPSPWGLILTGILGLSMIGAGITGLFIHRHLIRDIFVSERPGDRLVSKRDRHVLAASWALPFSFLLGFTGAFFSFAISIGLPMMATVAFEGDREKMMETMFLAPLPANETPKRTANLDRVIADASARAGTPVFGMIITHFNRSDAQILTFHDAPDGELFSRTLRYEGATGAFKGEKPFVGKRPSAGNTLLNLMPVLHFGTFAGVLSKIAWVGLGAAMAFVIVTGMRLWLRKREDERLWQRFARALTAVTWGLPLAMIVSAYAFFSLESGADQRWWTPASFVFASLACIFLAAVISDDRTLGWLFRQCLGIACVVLPVYRMVMGGTGWPSALESGYLQVISLDLFLVFIGAALLWFPEKWRVFTPRPIAEPAE